MSMVPPCIVCGRDLPHVFDNDADKYNQPAGGTAFSTNGHYGSTVFDPMNSVESLEINVCDDCLRTYHERVLYLRSRPPRPEIMLQGPWKPDV